MDYFSSLASHLQNRPDENSVGKGSLPHSNQKKNVTLNTDQAIASSSVDMGGVLASIFGGIVIFKSNASSYRDVDLAGVYPVNRAYVR